jgi:hypothetical protein
MSYVARACTLNVVDADERGCAQTVFNTLNKRGSPLSGADIIKSDLLENSKLSNTEADAAARKWEQTEDLFERENFARLLYMMPFLLTGEPLLSPGDLASFRTAVERTGGVRAFLFEQLPQYAHALRAIYAGSIDVGPRRVQSPSWRAMAASTSVRASSSRRSIASPSPANSPWSTIATVKTVTPTSSATSPTTKCCIRARASSARWR